MIAKDIMTERVITAPVMTNQISGVPVVDGAGKVLGVVSEADVLAKQGKSARDIMSPDIFTVRADASLEEIAALMSRHKIKRVLVVGEKELAGIVSRADIIRAIALGDYVPLQSPVYDL